MTYCSPADSLKHGEYMRVESELTRLTWVNQGLIDACHAALAILKVDVEKLRKDWGQAEDPRLDVIREALDRACVCELEQPCVACLAKPWRASVHINPAADSTRAICNARLNITAPYGDSWVSEKYASRATCPECLERLNAKAKEP